MKEVAVLKWHQVGCFAVAFSEIHTANAGSGESTGPGEAGAVAERRSQGSGVVPRLLDVSVKERRLRYAETAHWLAAGSKDGKISLWDVF